MAIAHLLEDFGTETTFEQSAVSNSVMNEDMEIEAFEKGYKAGWEDASKAQAQDQSRISSDLSQNLQDLSFTYHEAVKQLNQSLEPLLQEIIAKVLPEMSRSTLGAQVLEQLQDMTRDQTNQPIEIVCAQANAAALEALLEQEGSMPFTVRSDSTIGEGQVYLSIGSAEREINLDHVVEGIRDAVGAFSHQIEKELNHG